MNGQREGNGTRKNIKKKRIKIIETVQWMAIVITIIVIVINYISMR